MDKAQPSIWDDFPEFRALIPEMPTLMDATKPYTKSGDVWRCPSDNGSEVVDNHPDLVFLTSPSMHRVFASSYFYRTEIAFRQLSSTSFELPADVNVVFDAAGHWHGSRSKITRNESIVSYVEKLQAFRYNCLFGDMHAQIVASRPDATSVGRFASMTLRPEAVWVDGHWERGLEIDREGGRITEIRASSKAPEPYWLSPAFVNAHSHLEYRHMQGEFDDQVGYWDWIRAITERKRLDSPLDVAEACRLAAKENYRGGSRLDRRTF